MKKVFTLFASFILVASAFAQYGSRNDKDYGRDRGRDVVYNNGRYKNDNNRRNDYYSFNKRERDMQIAQINREYSDKIQTIKNKWFMSHSKKNHIIYELEEQRRHEIKMVYVKFNHSTNRFGNSNSRRNW